MILGHDHINIISKFQPVGQESAEDYGATGTDPTTNKKDQIISEKTKDYMCVDKQRCKDFGDYFTDVMGSTL